MDFLKMDWMKVVTDPLGLAAFALAAVFYLAGKRGSNARGVRAVALILAGACVVGGITLAYHRQISTSQAAGTGSGAAAPTVVVDRIEQQVGNGAAVAGVQGSVSVSQAPNDGPKPK
jgi:hypothetical protein